MIPAAWRAGEIAVIGLGKSGRSVAALLRREGVRVYVSDAGRGPALDEAAATLRASGVEVDVGSHDLVRIRRATLVVASPGVPPTAAPLAAARERGIPVVGEIEIALHFLPRTRSIAVTGTNGKTTTTALIGQLLRSLGHDAIDAGNIGTPLAEVALRERHPAWVALELSSFQLHDSPSIRPDVGVITNLGPDHLDRYVTADAYYADKALMLANAHAGSKWVLNGDQAETLVLHRLLPGASATAVLPGEQFTFSLASRSADAWYDAERKALIVLGARLLQRDELALFGDHNVANALAASLAVMVADDAHRTAAARAAMARGLREFRALKHRLEIAGEIDGVLWINDSKATNVGSTLVAIEAMTRPVILLLGGRHKGEPYTALAEPLRRTGKQVIAYGESAPIVEQDLAGLVPLERLGSSFAEVIGRARALAKPGDVVLLSPACSSYDMFGNYEERGAEFKRLALAESR
jgi:UDP-N-acetylmuramoylalanine--D-glutamate ligase